MRLARRAAVLAVLPLLALLAACPGEEKLPGASPTMTIGHLFRDSVSELMIDLPANWRARYRVADEVTLPSPGLQRELAFRFVRADSTEAADRPMLVARVFDDSAWLSLPSDSVRGVFGQKLAGDETRAVVIRRASSNPFATGTPDALAYDSLMMALFARPLRVTLRTP